MATIRDVAKLAGVSVSTVSLVLNTTPEEKKVAMKTREKVNEVIRTLGYHPNSTARKLRGNGQEYPRIAVFWPLDRRVDFLGNILKALKSSFDKSYFKCELMVYLYEVGGLCAYRQLFLAESFQGVFIGAMSEEDMQFLDQQRVHVPVVLYNRFLDRYHSVMSNNQISGVMAAQLIKRSRLNDVTVFQNTNMNISAQQRFDAFVESCRELGITIRQQVYLTDNDKEQTIDITRQLVQEERIGRVCLYCYEEVAYASIFTMLKMGVKVPDDVKGLLLSAAHNSLKFYITPVVTSIDYPIDDMLSDCANILIYGLRNPEGERIHKRYEPRIIYGDTFLPV